MSKRKTINATPPDLVLLYIQTNNFEGIDDYFQSFVPYTRKQQRTIFNAEYKGFPFAHWAVKCGTTNMLKRFLAHPCHDIHVENKIDMTLIQLVYSEKKCWLIPLLISYGADPSRVLRDHLRKKQDSPESAMQLLRYLLKFSNTNLSPEPYSSIRTYQPTLLHVAVRYCQWNIAEEIIQHHPFDLYRTNSDGRNIVQFIDSFQSHQRARVRLQHMIQRKKNIRLFYGLMRCIIVLRRKAKQARMHIWKPEHAIPLLKNRFAQHADQLQTSVS